MKVFTTLVVGAVVIAAVGGSPALSAPTVDLTTPLSFGWVGAAKFYQYTISTSGGTGVLDPFLQIKESNLSIVQGYNTDYTIRTPEFQEVVGWSKPLPLNAVPKLLDGGVVYREFVLDDNENQGGSEELISLDDLRLWVSTDSTLTDIDLTTNTFATPPASSSTLVYSFGATDWIKIDYSLAPGQGKTDVVAHIPGFEGFDEDTHYVYLYSKFGAQGGSLQNTDGFEEWAVGTAGPIIPAPGAVVLGAIGVGFVSWLRRRKTL